MILHTLNFIIFGIMNRTPQVLRPGPDDPGILPVIAGRWSSRAFNPEKIPSVEILNRLIEAARWAPSAMNNQPWRFMTFGPENEKALKQARAVLTSGNSWALAAPRLLFILIRTDRIDGKENFRADFETGMATAQMALQAAHEGLAFHQMAGFNAESFRDAFSLPGNFKPVTAVALGYPGLIDQVPSGKRDMETSLRIRKDVTEIVFSNGEVPKL